MGEFLSHDPLGYIDSYNLFGFATFDPINGYDPFGLSSGGFWGGVVDFFNPIPEIKKRWDNNINQTQEEKDKRWDQKVRGKYPDGTFQKDEIIECGLACVLGDAAGLGEAGSDTFPNPKSLGKKIVKGEVKRQTKKQAKKLKKKLEDRMKRRKKPINLPAWKKVKIDMEHIASGHMTGGSRISKNSNKTIFPEHMSVQQVEKAVRQAYRYGKKLKTQGDSVKVRGNGIDMWVNTVTKTIETAYPTR